MVMLVLGLTVVMVYNNGGDDDGDKITIVLIVMVDVTLVKTLTYQSSTAPSSFQR